MTWSQPPSIKTEYILERLLPNPQSVEAVFGGSPRVVYIKRSGREIHW